jgi:hypothetical protein
MDNVSEREPVEFIEDDTIIGGGVPESWAYRFLAREEKDETLFEVGRVYFDTKGKVTHYSDRIHIEGESPTQLVWMLEKAIEQCKANEIYWADGRFPQTF